MAKGLEEADLVLSLVRPVCRAVWQKKYLYIHNTRQRRLWLEVFGFFLAYFFCLFVCFRRQRVRVHLKSLTLNRACHCC